MNTKSLSCLAAALLISASRSFAAATGQTADVTEVVNEVLYGPDGSSETRPAHVDTQLPDGSYLKTGTQSRAELRLPSTSVTRIGANTIFNFSAESNTLDLQSGTILFCKPKESPRKLNVKTAAVTAGIVGTTGFVQVTGQGSAKTYRFGLVEGKAYAEANGKTFLVHGGEVLEFTPGSTPRLYPFDVPNFVHSSPLFRGFKGHLPNEKYIDEAIANYLDDERRGFVGSTGGGSTRSFGNGTPGIPVSSVDSVQNARQGEQPGQSHSYPSGG